MSEMTKTPPDRISCPPVERLAELVHGQLTTHDVEVLSDHVGECGTCQKKMDRIATHGNERLTDIVKNIDKTIPPRNSALWAVLNNVEATLTSVYPTPARSNSADEPKFDFLQPSQEPGFIGQLGTFQVRRMIGRGGMGVVFDALDPSLNRDVAIKVLDPMLANNETARLRFSREARAAASVNHDHIVAVYQVAEADLPLQYMVMQLVTGETLEQKLRRVGKLTIAEAVRYGAQAAAGLAAAHANGLIHRDIKPGNMLIEASTDKLKLTDFGLARAAEDLKLTRSGFVAGTPLYMAPEQALGAEIDSRADLFSLGSVLYESLAGKPPFQGNTPVVVLRQIADIEHPRLRKLNREVPDWFEDIIDQLLSKNPRDRFQSAADVAEILQQKLPCVAPAGAGAAAPCVGTSARSFFFSRWRRRGR
ncbi:MAG: serine/threonine-protein kinase, partial [Gemmataceae bacterium]